ncbi:hypothetical protein FIBSPDRAFT_795274 [Athelia psychrophila]|uniref:Uncharacterized protein n=1 Tax=Athelia psychrophila TaxID=1759441 RepID=A0A166EDT1_9AGAM|nr:hypothetical protein FIBSPDRAFT_795274 [Fibularhizoctonia sp. CBS 109695]
MPSLHTPMTSTLLSFLPIFLAVAAGWAVLRLKRLGHSARIARIRPLSLSGIHYSSKSTGTSISIDNVHLAFHLPRPSNPRWATLTVTGYEHKSSTCHFSLAELRSTLWLFPLLFRASAGPWMRIDLAEARVRVYRSAKTPEWVQRLRVNLVRAVLKGTLLRCDQFTTRLALSSVTGTRVAAGRDSSAPVEKPGVERPDVEDEVRITTDAREYETRNWLDRVYAFGLLQCQLRKSWVDGRGSLVLVAERVAWTKVQSATAAECRATSFVWQLVCSVMMLPADLVKFCADPSALLDLRITRLDCAFDTFRIRDAELLRQGFGMMQASLANRGTCFRDVFLDFLGHAIKS